MGDRPVFRSGARSIMPEMDSCPPAIDDSFNSVSLAGLLFSSRMRFKQMRFLADNPFWHRAVLTWSENPQSTNRIIREGATINYFK